MKPPRAYPTITTAWQRLAEHLGDAFDLLLTEENALRPFLDEEWTRLQPDFYHHSHGYLYDLTLFHYSGIKDEFFQTLLDFASEHGITDIADVGCGIGLDAQALLISGHDVHAYDLDNPSLAYARWRLDRDLGAANRTHTLADLAKGHHDMVYAVDVLGHATAPETLIDMLFTAGDYVALNLLPHDPRHRFGAADLHPGLDHSQILPLLSSRGAPLRLAASGQNVTAIWKSRR
ncbi:class I SAM-dependent methyltransferase [Actinoallomurus sp. NBC_01490]|uniref:class I SAM-dependent methyltransferase n=1 Tax=Actinoallomurus sp. NBC_01490 TaxID=2903557 RepID=UPI002E30D99A|nr:class I SAM-dependent methyltransferase [Actinoallomurus sp. NBC_01490]